MLWWYYRVTDQKKNSEQDLPGKKNIFKAEYEPCLTEARAAAAAASQLLRCASFIFVKCLTVVIPLLNNFAPLLSISAAAGFILVGKFSTINLFKSSASSR